ncbi:16036_t:CDS:2, partial [Acaulospora morrowiae]
EDEEMDTSEYDSDYLSYLQDASYNQQDPSSDEEGAYTLFNKDVNYPSNSQFSFYDQQDPSSDEEGAEFSNKNDIYHSSNSPFASYEQQTFSSNIGSGIPFKRDIDYSPKSPSVSYNQQDPQNLIRQIQQRAFQDYPSKNLQPTYQNSLNIAGKSDQTSQQYCKPPISLFPDQLSPIRFGHKAASNIRTPNSPVDYNN